MLKTPLGNRAITAISMGVVLGIAACVSLAPSRGSGSVPVISGGYRNGRDQIVRIALATAAPAGQTPGSGQGPLVIRPESNGSFVVWNGKRYRGELVISATDSGLLVVNRLPMDDYLRGVVPLEIGGNRTAAEFAAVQAQAVAARTYAYKHVNDTRAFDMYATVQDQVYGGVDAEKPQTDSAIMTTADVVVLYNGQPITTPYHSTCGGSTAGVSEVWYDQPDQPYLRPVSDRVPGTDHFYCDSSPRFSWTQSFDGPGLRAVMEKYSVRLYESAEDGRRQDHRHQRAGANRFRAPRRTLGAD